MQKTNSVKSVYIHIPFCKNICSYCDFCKNLYNEKIVLNYLEALYREIKTSYKNEPIKTIYIGGGTPSVLSPNMLNKLFDILKEINLCKIYEFTFECNYEDITESFLIKLKENKVNRLSIGIQSFNRKFESILKRKIDKEVMLEKINLAKKYFDNINLDLMYGFNTETINDLKSDLEEFIKLDIAHISTYSLILEENTKLYIDGYSPLNEDMESNMYYEIISFLKNSGYTHYELSNFSKQGFESKHNLTYWNNEEYYGFGAGASGFINNIRYDNTKSVFNYINGKTRFYEEKLSLEQKIKDEVMLALRKVNGILKEDFINKYNYKIEDVFDVISLINAGYLEDDLKNVYIPSKYLFVSNEIIIKLIDSYHLN